MIGNCFVKIKGGAAFIKGTQIGGECYGSNGWTLEQFVDIPMSDGRVVAIMKHSATKFANFMSYVVGSALLESRAWIVCVRELNPQALPVLIVISMYQN